MGILNITPDSFYDGNKFLNNDYLTNTLKDLFESDILDIGCESSKPGSESISESEEIKRLDTILPAISSFKGSALSIDTSKRVYRIKWIYILFVY